MSNPAFKPEATPLPPHPAALKFEALPPAYFFAPDIEREINRLESVTSAKVLSTGSVIDEIHVLASRSTSPKKIVRDIESLLLVRFGIRIDHRCISVVQLDQLNSASPANNRPRIEGVVRDEQAIHLTLAIGENVVVGKALRSGEADDPQVTARAVIHAIEQLLQTPGVLAVLGTNFTDLREYRIVIVLLRWSFADQHELLVGASLLAEDLVESVARATLDAVNRRLVRFQAAKA